MIGLLHRLATRATGTAKVLRSDAALPYAADRLAGRDAPGPPVLIKDEIAVAGPDLAPTAIAAAGVERVVEQDEDAIGATGPAASLRRQPAPQPRLQPPVEPPRARAAPARDAVSPAPSAQPAAPASSSVQEHVASTDDARALHAPAGHQATTSVERVRRVPTLFVNYARAVIDAERAPSPARTAAARNVLSDRADNYVPVAARLPATPSAEPNTAPTTDTTEVHIHIGRIEVTAVHEAPKTRTKPAAKPSAPSLDEYLAARSQR